MYNGRLSSTNVFFPTYVKPPPIPRDGVCGLKVYIYLSRRIRLALRYRGLAHMYENIYFGYSEHEYCVLCQQSLLLHMRKHLPFPPPGTGRCKSQFSAPPPFGIRVRARTRSRVAELEKAQSVSMSSCFPSVMNSCAFAQVLSTWGIRDRSFLDLRIFFPFILQEISPIH